MMTREMINKFFDLVNREARKYNACMENHEAYTMSDRTFFAIFWRLEAAANPANNTEYTAAAWLRNVYEYYIGRDLVNTDYFESTVLMERAAELNDGIKAHDAAGWFVAR